MMRADIFSSDKAFSICLLCNRFGWVCLYSLLKELRTHCKVSGMTTAFKCGSESPEFSLVSNILTKEILQ